MKRNPIIQCLLAIALCLAVTQSVEAGKLRRLLYYNYPGAAVTNLFTTNSYGVATFPDLPDYADYMPYAGGPGITPAPPYNAETAANILDNYGSWVRGYLTAPETGNYTFWLASDDEGQFYMNTDPTDPLNPAKTNLIAWVPGYSGNREWGKYPQQQSAPVALEHGKTYYVEILHKEGGGGDFIALGWQTPSGALERPMPAWHFQPVRDTNALWLDPDVEVVLGPVVPVAPSDSSIYDGMRVVVYANVNLDQPVSYQWFRNSIAVPGATNAYYLFRAQLADSGSQWTVQVTSGGTPYTGGPAILTVYNSKPTVTSAGLLNPAAVQVVFSKEVNPATATNTVNYSIPGATIHSATLAADAQTVTLATGLLMPTQVYTLTINNVQDLAIPANTMDPYSTNFIIAEGAISFRVYNTSFATDLASLRTWSNTNSTNPTYTNNLYNEERLITTTSYQWPLVPLRDNYMGQMIGYITAPETGNYKFAIASDDHSILYLGTTDQRSSKREICNYNGSTGQWNLGQQLANQQSAFIPLVAGQRYYIEAVYRDGTGGDGVTVCWQKPSDVVNGTLMPTANASVQANTQPFLIPAAYLSTYSTFGPVTLKTNLSATLTAAESTQPTLRVTADGIRPYSYQWYKNGAAIVGATATAYTLPYVRPTDSGATFMVIVTNNFSSVTSVVATLTVTSDTVKPAIASVGSVYKQVVEVRFSEPITPNSATNTANYLLLTSSNVTVAVNAAIADTNDGTHVTLQTGPMPDTDLMKLVVQNVADLSAAANVINPATNAFRALNFDGATRIGNTQPWSVTANGDQILMTAGGSDIWGGSDQAVFVYKAVTGNFDYKVQGVSLPAINTWCKMGLMGRASTDANSRNVFNPFTPVSPGQNTYSAQVRDTTGGASTSSNDAGSPLNLGVQGGVPARPTILPYPSWTRIQRIGNTFYYYYGSNGTNWTFWTYYDSAASAEGPLTNTLLVGFALTSHDTTRTVDGVLAQFIGVNDGPLRFTLQPTNTTVVEGGTTNFYVAAAGSTPYFYQWLTNGTSVGGATNATLTLTRIPYSFNGLQVACRLTNPYGDSVTSTNGILTVVRDIVAPTVRYLFLPKINVNATEVRLLYSEPMNAASAQNVANYQVTTSPGGVPLAVSAALLDVDERTVILTTAPQTAGTLYQVVVNNVTDQACCPPNVIAANSTDYFYYAGSSGKFAQRADGYVSMEAENYQRETIGTTPARDWVLTNSVPGFSGRGYMVVPTVASTTGGTTVSAGVGQGTGPKMEYDILFTLPATNYTVWIRGGNALDGQPTGNNDSIFVGFDGNLVYLGPTPTTAPNVDYSQATGWNANYQWRSQRGTGTNPLTITNVAPGVHTLVIWQREDGTLVDKVIIEPGNRGSTTAPGVCNTFGGLGDPETWDWIVAPPAAPTITISNPTNGQTFVDGANIPIETVVTGGSPITLVEFFSGTNLIGTATASPFSLNWLAVPEGLYTLTARVTDVLGYQATSAAVRITVDSSKPVAYAVGSLGGTGVGVYFSDTSGIDASTATNPANYTVNGGAVSVTNAVLEPDNLAVMLSLSAPISGAFSVDIKNVADRGAGPNVLDPVTLQSTVVTGFLDQDIGTPDTNNPALFTDPIQPGLAQAIGTNGIYMRAGGHDVWDLADGFHFTYVPVTGDFDVAVRVAGLLQANAWTKAGLMVREDLDGTSRNHLIAATTTNGVNLITMQWRPTKGAASVGIADASRPRPSPIPNAWLRVTRTNDVYTFLYGTNGTAWTALYTTNLAAAPAYSKVYVGLATTSHDNGTNMVNLTSAYYRDLSGLMAPLPPSPLLSVRISGTDLILSWTSSSASFTLKSSPDLTPNSWLGGLPAPVVVGNTYTVTVPIIGSQQFYRLIYTP